MFLLLPSQGTKGRFSGNEKTGGVSGEGVDSETGAEGAGVAGVGRVGFCESDFNVAAYFTKL
jgi:hypothetical protein